jgi:hypothetical protein
MIEIFLVSQGYQTLMVGNTLEVNKTLSRMINQAKSKSRRNNSKLYFWYEEAHSPSPGIELETKTGNHK